MKIQINRGNGNKQISDNNTTTQIQIGAKESLLLVFGIILLGLLIAGFVMRTPDEKAELIPILTR